MSSKAPAASPPAEAEKPDPLPRDPAASDRLRARKLRDLAFLLPVLGAFCLLPPFIRVFATAGSIGGVPVIVVWLFGSWAALILLAWRLSRQLDPESGADPGDE